MSESKPPETIGSGNQPDLSSMIANLPGFIYRCRLDKEYTMEYISDGCLAITGYTPENFTGNKLLSFTDLMVEKYRKPVWKKWQRVISSHGVFEEEYEIVTKSGEIRWVWERGRGIYNHSGELLYLEGFITDVTERVKATEKLKDRDRIFRHSIDMLCIAGFDGYFKVLNPSWSRVLGYSDEELLAKPWTDFVHPDDKTTTESVKATIVNNVPIYQFENRYICKDGSIRWLSWNSFPYPEDEIMYGVARDITAQKSMEDEIAVNRKKLTNLVNVVPVGIGVVKNRIIEDVNPFLCRMLGYELHELTRVDARKIYADQKEYERVGDEKYRDMRATGSGSVETRWQCKDGSVIDVLLTSTWVDRDDQSHGSIFTALDISAQKLSENEIRFQEHKWRSLVQNNRDIISMCAADGTILYKSPALKEVLGYEAAEVVGTNITEYAYPEQKAEALAFMEQAKKLRPNESLKITVKARHKDGTPRWLEASITNLLHEPGIRTLIGNYRNVTTQRLTTMISRIHYNIAHSVVTAGNLNDLFLVVRNELGKLIDTTNFIIALYNAQNGMLTAPFEKDEKTQIPTSWPAANSLSGYVIRSRKTTHLKKHDILDLAEKGEIQLRGARSECWLGIPLMIAGNPIGLIIIQSYDNPNAFSRESIKIAEMVANQLSIYIEHKRSLESMQKLSKAIVQSPASIVITDTDGVIEYVNPRFSQLTGYASEDAIGQKPSILKSGEHDEGFYKNLWETILAGKDWWGEFKDKKKSGELYWESAVISPILNEQGQITHFVAVKEDITERKKMVEDLIKAKEQAEAGDRLKTAFLNNISHEIRTPLNGIVGFGQLLSNQDQSRKERAQNFGYLLKSSNRLMQTVTDFLDISKITTGNLKLKTREFEVAPVFQAQYQKAVELAAEKGIKVNLHLPAGSDKLMIQSDKDQLNKVLMHLLDNAVKFTKQGKIDLGLTSDNNSFTIFVKDTGKGIIEENMGLIYNPFYQEDSSSTRDHEGSGLGLAIVKGIVELMGGQVSVNSTLGVGSEFLVRLPLRKAKPEEKKPEIIKPKKQLPAHPLVLIVEDIETNYMLLEIILKKEGYKTMYAGNGAEAVDLCRKHPEINLALMDIKMPVMDGIEATRIISSFRDDLPVIAITAYARSGEEHVMMEAGCVDYISKPFNKEKLMELIKKNL